MLDKDLFFSICERYNIEFNENASTPMIKEEDNELHTITKDDIRKVIYHEPIS